MAIIKAKQKKDYLEIPNSSARDKDISLEAKGLLCVLLSMPDDWKIYKRQISDYSTNGISSTTRAFNELIEKCYIIDHGRQRDEKGFLKESLYEVHQKPQPMHENRAQDNPAQDNRTLQSNTIHSITEIQEKLKSNKTLITNEESVDSSENSDNTLFGETPKPKSKKGKKEKVPAHPAYTPIVKFFCEEYWPDYKFFGARDGKQVKEIISQIERMLSRHGEDYSAERVVEFFSAVVTNAPQFYQKKSLPVINSKFSEIVEEIKKERNGQKTSKNANPYLQASAW